jgi:hypothetical protein
VQGSRLPVTIGSKHPLPDTLRIQWQTYGLPVINQSSDGLRAELDARHVNAGEYLIDVGLVWVPPKTSTTSQLGTGQAPAGPTVGLPTNS